MSSSSSSNSSSDEDFSEFLSEHGRNDGQIQGYLFQPMRVIDDLASSDLSSDSSDSSPYNTRLENSDW